MVWALVVSVMVIVIALVVVQIVVVPLWTAAPDTVQVTVIHHAGNGSAPDVVSTIFDRTMHEPAVAQRLQRDLAALPTVSPFANESCPPHFYPYDTYTLTWSRAGLFVETASADTSGCTLWDDVTLISDERDHLPRSDTIFVDLHTLLGAPLPPCFRAPTCRPET